MKKIKEEKEHKNPYNGVETVNQPITDIEAFTEYFNNVTKNQKPYSKKLFCVMLFYTEKEIGAGDIETLTDKFINTRNAYFHNGTLALNYYANTPCPASQLIDAETIEELVIKRNQMLINMNNEEFVMKYIMPF